MSIEPLMSAKSAVTVLRSPSGGVSSSAGNRAARDSVAEPLEEAGPSGAAQLPQNFMLAGLSTPHREQIIVGHRRGISIAAA
jgi:hypothetical protein